MTRTDYMNNLAARLGYQPQTSSAYTVFTGLGLIGLGLAVGAGVGVLLAPKAGSELRDDLSKSAGRLTEQLRQRIPSLADATNNVYDRHTSIG